MKKEFKIAIIIAFIVLLIVNLPLFYFNFFPKANLSFLNTFYINTEDVYTYVSRIEQAKEGRLVFENLYNTDTQLQSEFRPLYLLIGKFAQVFDLSSIFSYHFFRILVSIIFCLVLYKFLFLFFKQQRIRLVAFSCVLTAWGLEWLVGDIFLWIPSMSAYALLTQAPHLILAVALMMFGLHSFFEYLERGRDKFLFFTFLCIIFLEFEVPFAAIVVILTTMLYSLWTKQSIKKTILISGIFSFGLIFQVFQILFNPTFKTWNAMILLSQSPKIYILSFGFLLIFTIIGAEKLAQKLEDKYKLLFSWIVITAVLIYFPVGFQRRFLEGVFIPMSIIAVPGILIVVSALQRAFQFKFKPIKTQIFIVSVLFFLSLSTINTVFIQFEKIQQDSPKQYRFHLLKNEADALAWLKVNTTQNDTILANVFYGNIIPGFARRVYIGHLLQTADYNNKISKTNEFLLEKDDKKAISFLKQNNISYIFFGVNDAMIEYGFRPWDKPYLNEVYSNKGVFIYKVLL